jgi:large subunit ribosomal protein L24
MKKLFSTHWKESRQIRKQRKYRFNAPLHIKHKFLSSNLSKELRKKYGTRNVEVRKGDGVRIMTGEFRKKTGKIGSVDIKKERVTIEGLQRKKKDGTKINVYFHPSNIQITEIKEDKKRFSEKKEIKTEEKQGEKNASQKK